MGIGCKNVFVVCTFRSVLSVVAIAFEYFAERLYTGTEIRLAGVVFKADDFAVCFFTGEHIIADHALLGADGVKIKRAGKVTLFAVPCFIVLAQHLISAADSEHRDAVFDGGLKFGGLLALEIVHQNLLLKVLPAADKNQVAVLCNEFRPDRNRENISLHAAPFQPPLHTKNVSTVAVEIQNVGI